MLAGICAHKEMKLFVMSSDAGGDRNPIVEAGVIRHLPQVFELQDADAVVVPICYCHDYHFNTKLESIRKPVILIDFMEYGWDAGQKENLFGGGWLNQFGHINSDEWQKLDEWVSSLGQTLRFKRELFERDRYDWRLPIEFPCLLEIPATESFEVFASRPIEVFYNWGYSHPIRQKMHGRIFSSAIHLNAHIVDGWEQKLERNTWVTIHTPHYQRVALHEVMRWQHRSRASISLPGAGVKCFRSSEAPVGCVPVMLEDNLAWSYPWVDGENCIRVYKDCHIARLAEIVRDTHRIYDIYVKSQETIRLYEQSRYVKDYVVKSIEERL